MNQRMIDDLSDLLQGRDGEHREYPYGHPKFSPSDGSVLPFIPELTVTRTIQFGSEQECNEFFEIFKNLSPDARERTLRHFEEIGELV